MLQRSFNSLGGAYAVSQTTVRDLFNDLSQTYIRGLLFLFFGITFQQSHQLNPDENNVDPFNLIISAI